ncbi:unnamed protein product [Closterium sp. NIES-54]
MHNGASRANRLHAPASPWGPGGLGSVGCSSGPASWGARRGGRDVGPCQYRILTGPGPGTTCWCPDHSADRCYSRLNDLYPVTTAIASLSFTLDSGVLQCFFRDHTTVTPLSAPVPVALADPTSGPAVAHSSTTLPCPAVPSGFLTGLYIPLFSRNLVGFGYLQDCGITVTFPAHGRTAIYTDGSTGAILATFTREPHSSLFVLHTTSSQVAESSQVTVSPQVAESNQVTASPPVAVSSRVAASALRLAVAARTDDDGVGGGCFAGGSNGAGGSSGAGGSNGVGSRSGANSSCSAGSSGGAGSSCIVGGSDGVGGGSSKGGSLRNRMQRNV